MEPSDRVLALVPAYNEAERVARVVEQSRAFLPVLVVDDGSVDETVQRSEAAGAEVLRQQPNQGKGAALKAGFKWALEHGYAAVVTLDADGQHDPAEIPRFLEVFTARKPDLIIGARDFSRMPFIRRMANSFGTWAFSWAMGQHIRDNQSGYRLIGRRMMGAVLESGESGFEFEVEMIVECTRRGFVLDWVPIRTIYAGEHSHIQPLGHTLKFFQMVWRTRQRIRKG